MAKIIIAGDMFPDKDNRDLFEKGDGNRLFGDKLKGLFADADFSIVNLEGVLTDSSSPQQKAGPVIKASLKTVNGFKALGVRAVSLANNHVTDYLQQGVEQTVLALEKENIAYAGAYYQPSGIAKYLSLTMGGKKVCVYCVSETFYNEPFVHVYDEYLVCNDIARLKRDHDFFIVLYHGGRENFPYPTPSLWKRFHRMADCGADFVTAQHTHCIGCEEIYNGSHLLYGQGNFFFPRMSRPINREGLVCEINLDGEKVAICYHLVKVKPDSTIRYADNQDLEAFHERGREITSEDVVASKFKENINSSPKLKELYVDAYRGKVLKDKVIKKLFPTYYMKYVCKKFDKHQLMRILFALESDRMREDVTYMWKNISEQHRFFL